MAGTTGWRLHHPGRAERWWLLPDRWVWWDGALFWTRTATRATAHELAEAPDTVVPSGARLLVSGSRIWALEGLRAERLRPPLSLDDVRVWSDVGFVYRRTDKTRCVAVHSGPWRTGPRGALLGGDAQRWSWAAAPGRSAQRLEFPLSTEHPVHWAPDGAGVAGVDADGRALRLDTRSGAVLRASTGAQPVDWDRDLPPEGGDVPDGPRGLRHTSIARRGSLLAGPAGVCWDLETGHPCFEQPVVEPGATVATSADWVSVHWETGAGCCFDPRTGSVRARFALPLDADDVVTHGIADGASAVFGTALGAGWRVRTGAIEQATATRARRSHRPPGWGPLPVQGSATVEGRCWGWNDDGLLVSRPQPAGGPSPSTSPAP